MNKTKKQSRRPATKKKLPTVTALRKSVTREKLALVIAETQFKERTGGNYHDASPAVRAREYNSADATVAELVRSGLVAVV